MRRFATWPALLLLAACGTQSNEDALLDAANQSDPAAAAVLENAADNGMDPQQALEEAGEAAARSGASTDRVPPSVQAKPNLPDRPNRPADGQPPEKIPTGNDGAAEDEHAGHDMNEMQ